MKVPEKAAARIDFRGPLLEPLSDRAAVRRISENDLELELDGAEGHFRPGAAVEEAVLSFPGAGRSGIKYSVRESEGSRCLIGFESVTPSKPLLNYLRRLAELEKEEQEKADAAGRAEPDFRLAAAGNAGSSPAVRFREADALPKERTPEAPVPPVAAAAAGPKEPAAEEAPGKKILVVDDARAVHEKFGPVFAGQGYEVLQALDGVEGIRLAIETHPDLVIMDVNMPRMNGVEAARIIKANSATAAIPVCMFTSDGDETLIRQAIRIGVKDYILKTGEPSAALSRIRKILGA